jgi:hypothetical protein
MVIQRTKGEIIIRIPSSALLEDVEQLVDYLRYAEIASRSKAKSADLNKLVASVKKSRRTSKKTD